MMINWFKRILKYFWWFQEFLIIQAILVAGGTLDWKANKGHIDLLRINSDGSATRSKYKFNLSEGVSKERNPQLKDQDIVSVNSSGLQILSTGLGAIADPITPVVSGLSLLKLLSN